MHSACTKLMPVYTGIMLYYNVYVCTHYKYGYLYKYLLEWHLESICVSYRHKLTSSRKFSWSWMYIKEIEKEKIQYAYLGQIRISQTWCMELTKWHIIAAHLSTHYPSCFIQHAMFPRSARRPFTYTNLILWTLFNHVLPDTCIPTCA